eukprot:scaffold19841_cov72-Phaeocystis_antarctica.AAC.2
MLRPCLPSCSRHASARSALQRTPCPTSARASKQRMCLCGMHTSHPCHIHTLPICHACTPYTCHVVIFHESTCARVVAADLHDALGEGEPAAAVLLVLTPLPLVRVACGEAVLAVPVLLALAPLALIGIAVSVAQLAVPVVATGLVLALVHLMLPLISTIAPRSSKELVKQSVRSY